MSDRPGDLMTVPRRGVPREEARVGDLARRITQDVNLLARNHLELARTEATAQIRTAAAEALALLAAAIVALIGLALLCVTAVVALEPLIASLALRMLIMSFVYLLAGGAAASAFATRLRRDAPPSLARSRTQARRTAHAFQEQGQHG